MVEKSLTVQEGQQSDGFTLVRRNNRRAGKSGDVTVVQPEVMAGRNLREIVVREDSANIAIANRFGSLGEDMERLIRGGESRGKIEENKENEIIGINKFSRGRRM
ncbi:unnamed protein product [Arabidopsis halleri]